MISKVLTLAAFVATAGAVAYFGAPEVAATAPATTVTIKPAPVAAEPAPTEPAPAKCPCSGNCECDPCLCKVADECLVVPKQTEITPKSSPAKVNAVVPAEPLYTHPQRVAQPAPKAAPVRYAQPAYRLEYQASYGRFGMRRGGQWVRVPVSYQYSQPTTYRYYRSGNCANGSCR